jgi:hypothetical protein
MIHQLDYGLWEIDFEQRIKGLEGTGAKLCTLDAHTASTSFGHRELASTTPSPSRWLAEEMQRHGIKPEWEVFSLAHVLQDVSWLIAEGLSYTADQVSENTLERFGEATGDAPRGRGRPDVRVGPAPPHRPDVDGVAARMRRTPAERRSRSVVFAYPDLCRWAPCGPWTRSLATVVECSDVPHCPAVAVSSRSHVPTRDRATVRVPVDDAGCAAICCQWARCSLAARTSCPGSASGPQPRRATGSVPCRPSSRSAARRSACGS